MTCTVSSVFVFVYTNIQYQQIYVYPPYQQKWVLHTLMYFKIIKLAITCTIHQCMCTYTHILIFLSGNLSEQKINIYVRHLVIKLCYILNFNQIVSTAVCLNMIVNLRCKKLVKNNYLLSLLVCWYMKNVSYQQQNSLNQQGVLFKPVIPFLKNINHT